MNIFELVGLEERALKMKERVVEKIVEYASGIYYGHNYAKLDPTDIPIPENIYTKDFYDKSLKNIEKLDRNACQKGYNEAIEMFRSKGSNYKTSNYSQELETQGLLAVIEHTDINKDEVESLAKEVYFRRCEVVDKSAYDSALEKLESIDEKAVVRGCINALNREGLETYGVNFEKYEYPENALENEDDYEMEM